jgi:hypothetical protein
VCVCVCVCACVHAHVRVDLLKRERSERQVVDFANLVSLSDASQRCSSTCQKFFTLSAIVNSHSKFDRKLTFQNFNQQPRNVRNTPAHERGHAQEHVLGYERSHLLESCANTDILKKSGIESCLVVV